ncbi:MAG: AAA family ATPase, partial [Clostridia bacterium]|nr:AAA family ATPase [Clostridia bacterium]
MLSALHIENIAIIDQLDVEFESGFIVLTGETGAGKSIIIDSIQLLLGNKASKELVRTGEEYGIVSACFHSLSKEAIEILHTNDLDVDEEGNLTIYRKIGTDGRNNSRINGVNVTVSLLRQLGEHLINIHGQHDGVLLMDNRRHLSYLDEFGNISTDEYECAYKNVKEIKKELNDMQAVEATKAERKKQLEGYLEQLNACDLKLGEYDDLMCKRKNLILNAEIIEALHGA